MADDDYLWDPTTTPDPEIARLEALLRPGAHRPAPLREAIVLPKRAHPWRRPALVAATALLAAGGLHAARRATVTPWAVDAERGSPTVRGAGGETTGGRLARGGVVETDARSTAVLTVGRIGRARLEPGSRLRLLGDGATQHLLALERGTMHATIDAPPRYFLVRTAGALAVDLGCVYTLTTDERGDGLLTVEEGEVELLSGGARAAVLAGNAAAVHGGRGPGLPYPVHASPTLRRAIAAYDLDPANDAKARAVVAASDSTSTITLWHLLQRASPAQRELAFARLASIAPPPATVTRERVLRGESGALQRWRTDLQPRWITEPPLWRKLWLAIR